MRSVDHNQSEAGIPPAVVRPSFLPPTEIEQSFATERDAELGDIAQLACVIAQSPTALICSRDQQGWRLSHNPGSQTEPLTFDLAFYTFAVTQRRAFEISDLRGDPAFASSPLVTGPPHFRFFAGAPVISEDDQLLGAICVLDTRPRALTLVQRQGMEALARQIRAHLLHQKASTAHLQAQAAARERERQWQRLFESSSIGLAEITPEGVWAQVNGAFCAILGYSVNEISETRPRDLIHPDDLDSSLALIRKTLAGEIPSCAGEKRLLHKTGRCIWCSIHVTLIRDSQSNPAYFVAHIIDISEMRAAQIGWRDAELKTQTLLELPVPVGIATTDEQGGITFANRHFEHLTGYTGEDLSSRRAIASFFLDAELREHSQRLVRFFGSITHGSQTVLEHARNSGPETREWTWLRKDGSAIRVTVTIAATRDAQGAINGFAVGVAPTGRAEEGANGTVEGRFRAIADSAPLGMFLTDAHGNCTYVNDTFRHITGFGSSECLGQGWYSAFDQAGRAEFYNEFQKALRRGADFFTEIRLAREGEPAWVRVRGREIFFDDVAQGYVGTIEEITGSYLLLQKLKAGEARLRSLITSAPFPVVLLDRDRKCVLASVGWLDLHHRSWQEANGRNIFGWMPEIRDRLEDFCRRALNGGQTLAFEHNLRFGSDAPPEYLRFNFFTWRSEGEICGVGIFEERLTQQMRLLAEAESAREAAEAGSRLKSDFLASVSSELRTPGSGIIGLADILLDKETNPERREYLEMIKTSTGSWLKLAGEIHEFSRMESRKLELEALPFNFLDGLSHAMRRLAVAAENKRIELICQTSPDLPSVVVGDGGRLFQLVSHLVAFAIDMSSEGEVSLKVALDQNSDPNPSLPGMLLFHFSVKDTSGWLTGNKLADVQQVLLMVENSPALKKIGTSLGLVLAARLAALMNGRLWVERAESGAAFHFTVPLSGKRPLSVRNEVLANAPILIADANPTHRQWLQETLAAWGMRPTALEKPGAILDVLEIAHEAARPFRFVLLDAHIPDRDTFALAAQIKENPRSADVIPIMLLSASLRVADEARARELGLDHVLVKPINAHELREKMEQILGHSPCEAPVPIRPVRRSIFPKPRWNILLVDNSRINQEVAMGVLGSEGHRVTVARNGKEAIAILERRACELVLLGLDIPGEDSLEILAAIRQREKQNQKQVRIFGLTSDPAASGEEEALKSVTDGFLPNPIQPKDLTLLLEQIGPELDPY